jgi:hypothetical protein
VRDRYVRGRLGARNIRWSASNPGGNAVEFGDLFAVLGSDGGIVRAVRVLGWIIFTTGILTILYIPDLYETDAAEEIPWVIGVSVVGILAGFLIVWFTAKTPFRVRVWSMSVGIDLFR